MNRSASRILVLGRPDVMASDVAAGLRGPAAVDVCEQVRTAVEWVTSACGAFGGYDAILCQAERPDELSFIVRLRKQDPDTPIVLVSGRADHPDFRELACRMGATAVVSTAEGPGAARQAVLRAAEACRNARILRRNSGTLSRIAEEIREAVGRHQALVARSLELVRKKA